MSELIASYKQGYTNIENWAETIFNADKILDSKKYIIANGTNNYWNSIRSINIIIPETTLESIIHTYIPNLDHVEIDVYEDKVDFVNHHHDGTNRYTFTPIYLEDLKKIELLDIIDNDDELFKICNGKQAEYANKQELINFIEYEDLI